CVHDADLIRIQLEQPQDILCDNEAADIRDYYILGNKIGEGAYGQVRAVVANEVSVLRKLNHPNVCKPREFFQDEYFYYQVMQMYGPPVLAGLNAKFASKEQFHSSPEPLIHARLPEYRIAELIRSALEACAYIHSQGVVHRDIKGDNFLFETTDIDNGELVMIDFGLAIERKSAQLVTTSITPCRWVAPEMLKEGYNSGSVDVWAVGILLYILVYGQYPFDGRVVQNVLRSILY
ncbi:calcium-dependent protein kinase, putative, partial [Perkinsus marinus ATCC 50983]